MCPLECAGTRGLVGQLLPVGTILNLVRVGAGSTAVPCPNALYDGTEQCNIYSFFSQKLRNPLHISNIGFYDGD